MLGPKNCIEQATSLILDLQAIHKLKDNSIEPLQPEILQYIAEIEILQYIAAHPGSTAYDIWRKKGLRKDRDVRWIRKKLSVLEDRGLIERVQKAASQHKAKACRLTIAGLVYLILKRETMENDAIKGILKNYSNNALFQLFVYPYIKQETLQRLTSFNSLSPLSSFLYECCRAVEDAVRDINKPKNQYVTEGYLVWQSIPDDNRQTNRLRDFLKRELNLEWIDHAKLEKIGNGNTLRIFYKGKSVLIELKDTRAKRQMQAILTMKGKTIFEFTVKEYVEENENSKGCFIIEVPSKITTSEWAANFLLGYAQSRVPSFVFNLVPSVTTGSDDFQILSQDETFLDALEKTKTKFMSNCEMLATMRGAYFS